MCFSPTVSIITAIIEFAVALFIYYYFRRTLVTRFFAGFILLLGLYQLTEFMQCVHYPNFWVLMGFVVYTFLPAKGLKFALQLKNRKTHDNRIYFLPLLFSVLAAADKKFVITQGCGTIFVDVSTKFTSWSGISWFYGVYYLSFILMIIFLLSPKNKIEYLFLSAILISLVPALILLVIFPMLKITFMSIYCEFALVFTVFGILACNYDKKKKK